MTDNIDKVLARGEKLELLTDKTENLMFEVGVAWRRLQRAAGGGRGWRQRASQCRVPRAHLRGRMPCRYASGSFCTQALASLVVACKPILAPVCVVGLVQPCSRADLPSVHACVRPAVRAQADRFVRTGRTLRRKMWWQNCKMKIVVAFAVILLAVIIFLLVCFSGGNCLKHGK